MESVTPEKRARDLPVSLLLTRGVILVAGIALLTRLAWILLLLLAALLLVVPFLTRIGLRTLLRILRIGHRFTSAGIAPLLLRR